MCWLGIARTYTSTNTMQRDKNQGKNNINYHLSRMYPKIVGPHKRN